MSYTQNGSNFANNTSMEEKVAGKNIIIGTYTAWLFLKHREKVVIEKVHLNIGLTSNMNFHLTTLTNTALSQLTGGIITDNQCQRIIRVVIKKVLHRFGIFWNNLCHHTTNLIIKIDGIFNGQHTMRTFPNNIKVIIRKVIQTIGSISNKILRHN